MEISALICMFADDREAAVILSVPRDQALNHITREIFANNSLQENEGDIAKHRKRIMQNHRAWMGKKSFFLEGTCEKVDHVYKALVR